MQVAVREAKAKLSRYGDLAHQTTRRRTKPLPDVQPVVSEKELIRQLSPEDLPGWM